MTIEWDANRTVVPTLLDAIGRTPLVRLQRVTPEGVEILAKVEWYGPTGSVKDRIYALMLSRAEERGDLRPGMTIIECTTGNAGIACSAVAAIKGYPCVIVMPEGMSAERKAHDRGLRGRAGPHPRRRHGHRPRARPDARRSAASDPDRYFFPGEFENPDNPDAQLASGEEIWEQAGGRIDAVVSAQGTGGWISGVARALKAHDPSIKAFAVEPSECPLITAQPWGTHGVPGIGDGIIPPNLDLALMDGIVTASTAEALGTARRLAAEEGMLCGPSSGINVAAVHKVAAAHPELRRVRHRDLRHGAALPVGRAVRGAPRRRRARPRSRGSTSTPSPSWRSTASASSSSSEPMARTTTYRLYLDHGPKRKTTMVHVIDLMGCIANAATTEEALEQTPEAIRRYARFLAARGEAVDPVAPFETTIAEEITEGVWLGQGVVVFEPDRDRVSRKELGRLLDRHGWTRDATLDLVRDLTPKELTAKPTKGRPIAGILQHVYGADGGYLSSGLASNRAYNKLGRKAESGEVDIREAFGGGSSPLRRGSARGHARTAEGRDPAGPVDRVGEPDLAARTRARLGAPPGARASSRRRLNPRSGRAVCSARRCPCEE